MANEIPSQLVTSLDLLVVVNDTKCIRIVRFRCSIDISYFQVIGADIRYDRRWWKCGCSSNATNFLQGIQILERDRDNVYGCHDCVLHSSNLFHILPTMGWNVLRSIIFKDCYRGRLLLVRMDYRGEGERAASS